MSEITQDRPAQQLSPGSARPRSPVAEGWRLLGRSVLSLRVDGLGPSMRHAWARSFGTDCRYVFVQHLKPPLAPVTLPVEAKGVIVRQMTERDRDDPRVRRHEPRDDGPIALGVVATRNGQIVGASWYTDGVTPAQEWYRVVEPHLIRPAWYDANIFVVPGEKGAAWTLFKTATDVVASAGIRCTVALVGVQNAPSILQLRLLGAKVVARRTVRRRLGYRTSVVEPVTEDKKAI